MFREMITLLTASLVSLSGGDSVGALVGAGQSWQKLYVSGEEMLENKKYKEAEITLLRALYATNGNIAKEMMTENALEELYDELENYPEEEKMLLSSLRLMRSQRDCPAILIGTTCVKLAAVNFFMDHLDRAEQYAKSAVPILKHSCGAISLDVAVALNNLGWIEYERNKLALAETDFRRSLYIAGRTVGEKSAFYGMTANNLAAVYLTTGNVRTALLWYQRSEAALSASLGTSDPFTRKIAALEHELQSALHQHRKVRAGIHSLARHSRQDVTSSKNAPDRV